MARTVLFDIGGVLVRVARSFAEACDQAGVAIRPGMLDPAAAERRRPSAEAYQVGSIDLETYCQEQSAALAGICTPFDALRILDGWIIGAYPGGRRLVAQLLSRGVRTGMLSNTNARHWDVLPLFDAVRLLRAERPDLAFASHLLGLAKPDPSCFVEVAARAGSAPSDIIFFDDLEENVAAARAAGWDAIQVDPALNPPTQAAAALRARGLVR